MTLFHFLFSLFSHFHQKKKQKLAFSSASENEIDQPGKKHVCSATESEDSDSISKAMPTKCMQTTISKFLGGAGSSSTAEPAAASASASEAEMKSQHASFNMSRFIA